MLINGLLTLGDLATLGQLRRGIASTWSTSLNADALPGEQYTEPAGDPGLFGPDSMMWYVHDDPAGVVGGIMGLVLGSLHEPTMHGTNKHSVYLDDPAGRLGRTVSFVNTVTYASTPVAERMAATVRRMHKRVHGTMPDGRPYSATAPENIIWTGVTQAYGIAQAHLRYHPKPVSPAGIDQYYAEYAVISRLLGAPGAPGSAAEVADYFTGMRPRLTFSEETADVVDFFAKPFGRTAAARAASRLISKAAFDLLPDWGKRLYRIERTTADRLTTETTVRTVFGLLRASLGDSPIKQQALRRAAA